MAKRGRPKKDPVVRDKGTPELIMHKTMLVGDGDSTLTTTAIDIHLARKLISVDQHTAGRRFSHLHYVEFGKVYSQSSMGKILSGQSQSKEILGNPSRFEEFIHKYYDGARLYLYTHGGINVLRKALDIICYDKHPNYLKNIYEPMDDIILAEVRKSLTLLKKFFNEPVKKIIGK